MDLSASDDGSTSDAGSDWAARINLELEEESRERAESERDSKRSRPRKKKRKDASPANPSRNRDTLRAALDPSGKELTKNEAHRIMLWAISSRRRGKGKKVDAPNGSRRKGQDDDTDIGEVSTDAEQEAQPAPAVVLTKPASTNANAKPAEAQKSASDTEEEEIWLGPKRPTQQTNGKANQQKPLAHSDSEEEEQNPLLPLRKSVPAVTPIVPKVEEVEPDSDEEELIFAPRIKKESSDSKLPLQHPQNGSASRLNTLRPIEDEEVEPRPAFTIVNGEPKNVGPLVLDAEAKIQVPASINRFLRDYQRDGIKFIYQAWKEKRGCVLGDDMGLGKTVQVLAFLAAIMKKTGGSRDANRRMTDIRAGRIPDDARPNDPWPTCLIVCPASLKGNWCSELDTWGYFDYAVYGTENRKAIDEFKRCRLDIIVSSYEYVTGHIEELRSLGWSCVFADEAHTFKNPKALRTVAMNKLACQVSVAMTGTLVANRYEEMFTILDWVCPDRFGSLATWKDLVAAPLRLGQRRSANEQEQDDARLISRLLHDNLLPNFLIRRTKDLIAKQMPIKKDHIVFCPLAPQQLEAYKRLCDQPEVKMYTRGQEPCDCGLKDEAGLPYKRAACCYRPTAGVALRTMYLMTCLANHAALFYPDPNNAFADKEDVRQRHERQRQYTKALWPNDWQGRVNNTDNGAKQELCGKWIVLESLLRSWKAAGDKVLLFSKNMRLLDWVQFWVQFAGFNELRLDGKTPQHQRQSLVNQFNKDPKMFIFLISTQAGGVGLNLTGANKVVIFDPNWSPAIDNQAMDRAYRIGQTRDVDVFRLIGSGTLEEVIYGRQIYKTQAANIAYNNTEERRYFDGVEGEKGHEGELFGLANMFTLHETEHLTKTTIQQVNLDAASTQDEEVSKTLDLNGAEGEGDYAFLASMPSDKAAGSQGGKKLGAAASQGSSGASQTKRSKASSPEASRKKKAKTQEDQLLAEAGVNYTVDHQEVVRAASGSSTRALKAKQTEGAAWPPPRKVRVEEA